MKKFIQRVRENLKKRKQIRLFSMKQTVINALEKFYRDLELSSGKIDIPPYFKARQAYELCIKSDNDLIAAYKRLKASKITVKA